MSRSSSSTSASARGSSATIDQIQTYGYVAETTGGSETESAARRPLDSIAGRIGDWAARRSGPGFGEAKIREKLVSAGMYGTTPRKVLGYQVLCAIAFSLLVLWLIPAMGGSIIFAVVLAVAAGVGGWFAPVYYVELKRRQRMELIDKQMPDMIDLLVVTIEAGLGILASMRVASESMSDPLGQELRLTLQEQRMGLSVGQAIESLGRRATRRTCASSFARSPRASGSASRSARRCGTSRSRCASGAGRWPRSGRRRCRSRCSSR